MELVFHGEVSVGLCSRYERNFVTVRRRVLRDVDVCIVREHGSVEEHACRFLQAVFEVLFPLLVRHAAGSVDNCVSVC